MTDLSTAPPVPGLAYLARRLGHYDDFVQDIVDRVERAAAGGEAFGNAWDVGADPRASLVARLWAYVAEGVAAYTELTANEAYLGTALDWANARRLAGLLGYRPRPRIAAQGWILVDVERGADPVLPAGTRVQAPARPPERPTGQIFEVTADTQLHGDWGGLTAGWWPEADLPAQRTLRFGGDPGFAAGDRVLLARQDAPAVAGVPAGVADPGNTNAVAAGWRAAAAASSTPLALVRVVGSTPDLGFTIVEFDRDVAPLVSAPGHYLACRVIASAGTARHLSKVIRIPPATGTRQLGSAPDQPEFLNLPAVIPYGGDANTARPRWMVLDAPLDDVSAGQQVAVIDWASPVGNVVTVASQVPTQWEVAPGTSVRVSTLSFDEPGWPVSLLTPLIPPAGADPYPPLTVYVLDGVHGFDRSAPATGGAVAGPGSPGGRLRLWPAPKAMPAWVGVQTVHGGATGWEVVRCQPATPAGDGFGGSLFDLRDGGLTGTLVLDGRRAPATANLAAVRHGITSTVTLGSGDATRTGQSLDVPDAPVAYDLDARGNPTSSMVLRVDGVRWDEVPSLYGAGAIAAFTTRLTPEGGLSVEFGDGVEGQRLTTGTNNVAATYRVGGGVAGNLPEGAIDSLAGSVRGVRRVSGAGPTSNGADQDDQRRFRRGVAGRARAFDRAVSREDLADLAGAYPGVSHAAAWLGEGSPGCPCGGTGLHLAILRATSTPVPQPPAAPELASLEAFLDGRRDTRVPLCVCAGAVVVLDLRATLFVEARRDADTVTAAARAALGDPAGRLGPDTRGLGQPLVASDIIAVLHGVPGVLGVQGLSDGTGQPVAGAPRPHPYELLLVAAGRGITPVPA